MGTPTDPDLVMHVARLARLALTAEEQAVLGRQLADILKYVELLAEVDTTGVEPTDFAGPEGAFRAPGQRIALTRDERLANAPDASAGAFRVPRVL